MVDLTLTISVITKLDKPEKAEVQTGLKKKKQYLVVCCLKRHTLNIDTDNKLDIMKVKRKVKNWCG